MYIGLSRRYTRRSFNTYHKKKTRRIVEKTMATYSERLSIEDEYMTPKSAWEEIKDIIPKDKVIWEAFYGDGRSGQYLRELGFEVIHEPIDFFTNNIGDIVVSNPPFSKKREVLERLCSLNKPFILIMPLSTIAPIYMRELFKDRDLKIIMPKKRINYLRGGEKTRRCNFESAYFIHGVIIPSGVSFWLS